MVIQVFNTWLNTEYISSVERQNDRVLVHVINKSDAIEFSISYVDLLFAKKMFTTYVDAMSYYYKLSDNEQKLINNEVEKAQLKLVDFINKHITKNDIPKFKILE